MSNPNGSPQPYNPNPQGPQGPQGYPQYGQPVPAPAPEQPTQAYPAYQEPQPAQPYGQPSIETQPTQAYPAAEFNQQPAGGYGMPPAVPPQNPEFGGQQGYDPQAPVPPTYGNSPYGGSPYGGPAPKKSNTGKIVAIIVAVLAVLAIAGGLTWYFVFRDNGKSEAKDSTTQSQTKDSNKSNDNNSSDSNSNNSDSNSDSNNSDTNSDSNSNSNSDSNSSDDSDDSSSSNTGTKMYKSVADFAKTSEVQDQISSMSQSFEGSGMKIKVYGEGDTLVYDYEVSDELGNAMGGSTSSIESSLAGQESTFESIANIVQNMCETSGPARVRVWFHTRSGKTLLDKNYTATNS